jgi:hypothetical protein
MRPHEVNISSDKALKKYILIEIKMDFRRKIHSY